jgi:two-component system alkaline phosphatase synthesis response regulator PhoP
MADKSIKVLIVDDEPDILELLEYHLEKEGYKTKKAKDGEAAIKKAHKFDPDIIVLDVMMPEMNGIEVCKKLRELKQFKNTLITFLTARNEEFTEVMALDSGADDFMSKPLKPSVFRSRIKALARRLDQKKEEVKQVLGNLILDHEEICVILKGKKVYLAKKEFELLALLTSKPEKVFKRHKIMNKVWGVDVLVGDRTIDVHIRKLREKIGSKYISTVKGIGYKFTINAEE